MRLRFLMPLLVVLCMTVPVRAEHASIELSVYHLDSSTRKIKDQARAHVDEDPPMGGVNPRPVLKVKANEPLVLEFVFINTYPHGDIPNASVRYFVVRQEKLGQKALPDLKKGAITQGRFGLNFKLNGRAGARVEFKIKERGNYLLRVQSENTKSDHEHFSAIDLKVE